MWKLASHLLRRRRPSPGRQAWVAVGATATAAACAYNEERRGDFLSEETCLSVSPLTSWLSTNTKATFCEPKVGTRHFANLRRHHTVQKMEKTATKETLKSRFKVDWKKPLGEGSFGKVFLAVDRKSGETVAVKKMPKALTDNVAFQREMDALMHLRLAHGHPNICGLRENFSEGDHYYLVLDLVSGGEMFDHLCAQGAYSEADAARLVREIASALDFLHAIGIVHGDLKPENLMLSSENPSDAVVKIVDFGCAQTTVGDTTDDVEPALSRGTASTPAYSPPEVLEYKHAKRRSPQSRRIEPSFDQWALGVILYVMLTGCHPFDLYGNSSDEEIEHHIMSRKFPPLRNSPLTAHLSDDAIRVIERLLQWDPKKRLTAFQLLHDPWVQGKTARTSKIADSDKRLSAYRKFKSSLEAKVFADMVALSDEATGDVSKRTSLIERAFHSLDPTHKGYLTTSDIDKLTKHVPGCDCDKSALVGEDDEQLSLSGFSDLLGENMKNRYFPKGHIIYHEGDIGDNMYFINSGSIEVYTKDGFSKTLRNSGDCFGEGALMHPNKTRSASIRCITPVHAIEVSREYFEKYVASSDNSVKLNLREKDKSRKRQRAKTILRLQQSMEKRVATQGEFIYLEGEQGNELYILERGKVDVSVKDNSVFTVNPGGMFGEHSLLFGQPRNTTTQCKSKECHYHVLRSPAFYAILDSHPSMKESIQDVCLRREFQKAVCVLTKSPFPKNERDLRRAFDSVDINGSGVLELRNIRNAIMRLDPAFTEDDVRNVLRSLDLDDSGEVSWNEFKRIFGMGNDSDDAL